jgi:hypothetical protein
MKTMKRILVFLTAALLILSLASCSGDKAGSIKKAFEKADYEVTTLSGSDDKAKAVLAMAGLSEEQKKDVEKYEIIVCNKKTEQSTQGGLGGFLENIGGAIDGAIPNAIIIKFPSADDLKDFLTIVDTDGTKITTLYEKAVEDGKINGNCLLLVGGTAEKDIFN